MLFRVPRISLSRPQFAASVTPSSHSKEDEEAQRLEQMVPPLAVWGSPPSYHLFIVSLLSLSTYAYVCQGSG